MDCWQAAVISSCNTFSTKTKKTLIWSIFEKEKLVFSHFQSRLVVSSLVSRCGTCTGFVACWHWHRNFWHHYLPVRLFSAAGDILADHCCRPVRKGGDIDLLKVQQPSLGHNLWHLCLSFNVEWLILALMLSWCRQVIVLGKLKSGTSLLLVQCEGLVVIAQHILIDVVMLGNRSCVDPSKNAQKCSLWVWMMSRAVN